MTLQDKQRIEETAKLYAIEHSAAPDKETPDWIITDFRSGAEYEHKHNSNQAINLLNWLLDNDYIKVVLVKVGEDKKHFRNWKTAEDVLKEFQTSKQTINENVS